ncbi:uncharacterized protein LOC125073592 [Vanessa atalanta]|uniref:uncharacterized protein LOC125073592 n=1 Tax=Vanessa atalanta TaxID=42275 RepID=UPI001FCD045A|nr:uncharacterized protein LOC125073592 [Vanessa atalanta]
MHSEYDEKCTEELKNTIKLCNQEIQFEKMPTLEKLAHHIKKEVDDELIEKYNKNNAVDSICKIEGKRKQTVPDTTTDLHSPIIKRSKPNVHDSPVKEATELKQFNSELFILTTRLDEMCIFKNDLNRLNRSHIWEEISRESKPMLSQYKHNVTTQTVVKYKNLHKLYNDLKIINDKNSFKVFDDKNVCHIKAENDEMTDFSTNENFIRINVNNNDKEIEEETVLLNDYKINVNETRITENIVDILNESKNHITAPEISETLLQPKMISNSERETLSPKIINLDECEEPTKGLFERRKPDGQDPKALLRSLCCSIVYTTRLEDMCIFRSTIKYLDGKYVLKEILRESNPNVIFKQKTSTPSINKNNFKRLQAELKILNNKSKPKRVDSRSPIYNNFKLVPSDIFIQITNQSAYTKILVDPKISTDTQGDLYSTAINYVFIYNPKIRSIEKVEANQNISLLIHNKFRDMTEVFVTDNKGNVTELRRFKSQNSVELNEFINNIDSNKRRLKLTTCCWFHRNMNIDKVWSNTIARFVKSMHPCQPRSCECCCKPHLGRPSFNTTLNISSSFSEVDNASIVKLDKNSLIGRALDFRKPIKEVKNNKHDTKIRPLMIEFNKTERIEHYAIDSRGCIDWQITVRPYNNHPFDNTIQQLKNRSKHIPLLKETIKSTREHNIFINKLKVRNVPFNVINYLKCKILENSNEKIVAVTPKLKLTKEIYNIEHTRTYTLPSLIKIGQILKSKSMLKGKPIFDNVNKIGKRVPGNKMDLVPSTSNSGSNSPVNKIISGIVFKVEPDYQQVKTNDSFSLRPLQWPPSMQIYNPTTSRSIKKEVYIQDGDDTNNIINNKSFQSFIKTENNNTDIAMPVITNVFSLNDNNLTN